MLTLIGGLQNLAARLVLKMKGNRDLLLARVYRVLLVVSRRQLNGYGIVFPIDLYSLNNGARLNTNLVRDIVSFDANFVSPKLRLQELRSARHPFSF